MRIVTPSPTAVDMILAIAGCYCPQTRAATPKLVAWSESLVQRPQDDNGDYEKFAAQRSLANCGTIGHLGCQSS